MRGCIRCPRVSLSNAQSVGSHQKLKSSYFKYLMQINIFKFELTILS